MIYGEVFPDDIIYSECGNRTLPEGSPMVPDGPLRNWSLDNKSFDNGWIYLLLMGYLLFPSVLIAVFNHNFSRKHDLSHQIWKFNRFQVVMDYEQKPVLPPPFIAFSHIFLFAKWCIRRYCHVLFHT